MEPEAEDSCMAAISQAMLFDPTNPETWSLFGSFRISQQKNEEAKEMLQKSWDLYHQQLNDDSPKDTNDQKNIQEQFQQLIPSLIRLAQNSIEMELYRNVIQITAEIQRLDDQVPECYYLHGLSRNELFKNIQKQIEDTQNANSSEVTKLKREANRHAVRAREAWETLLKIVELEPELVDPEIAPTVEAALTDVPSGISPEDYDDSTDDEDAEMIEGEEDDYDDIDVKDLE